MEHLTNKETIDTDKLNYEPILATTKNRDIGYKYF